MTVSIKHLVPGISQEETRNQQIILQEAGYLEPIIWECQIPYVIDSSIVYPDKVKKAIEYVETVTNYAFIPRTNENVYIKFVDGNGCSSFLGKGVTQIDDIFGKNYIIILGKDCNLNAIIHELGHALGLIHTQERSDRDNYIEILNNNIIDKYQNQFEKTNILSRGDFDFQSVMLYDRYDFTKNNKPVMNLKQDVAPYGFFGFSIGDVKDINSKANIKKCPQKSKPPPCNETDVHFFTGNNILTYNVKNTTYYKVSDTRYESYDIASNNKVILELKEISNIIPSLVNPTIPRWVISHNNKELAASISSDLFNTQWQMYNIATDAWELNEKAKVIPRSCEWPDLSKYKEITSFHLVNFMWTNLFTIAIVLVTFIILNLFFEIFGGFDYVRIKLLPQIRRILKIQISKPH